MPALGSGLPISGRANDSAAITRAIGAMLDVMFCTSISFWQGATLAAGQIHTPYQCDVAVGAPDTAIAGDCAADQKR